MSESPKQRITTEDIEAYKREILDQSVLVTGADAARVLACSTSKVYGLARGGKLRAYNERSGVKGLRFLAAELRDYVQSIEVDWDQLRE